jgi:hypothetical protein
MGGQRITFSSLRRIRQPRRARTVNSHSRSALISNCKPPPCGHRVPAIVNFDNVRFLEIHSSYLLPATSQIILAFARASLHPNIISVILPFSALMAKFCE